MNNNIEIFCVTEKHFNFFNDIKYKLAAVGKNNFPSNYITCNTGENIFYKEEYYSELTFHYWFWKNLLNNYSNDTWIGFCQKRRFWLQKKEDINLFKQYIGVVDEFLLDSSAKEKSSIFDWSYLKNIEINEWFLAGGININNLEKASKISKKIDISSSLEDNPGVKSSKKVSDFLLKVKKL